MGSVEDSRHFTKPLLGLAAWVQRSALISSNVVTSKGPDFQYMPVISKSPEEC